MRTDNAASVLPDAALKNFIFYIFPMYEFSHSLGHSLPSHLALKSSNVRFAPEAAKSLLLFYPLTLSVGRQVRRG